MTIKNELQNLVELYKTYKKRPVTETAASNKLIILNNIIEQIIAKAAQLKLDTSKYELEQKKIQEQLLNSGIKIK